MGEEELSVVFVAGSGLGFSFDGFRVPSLSGLLLEVKSNPAPFPGVFGVLAEEPNEANAPDPRPKADEAAEGELVEGVAAVLKGLDLLCEDVSPNRRLVYVRGESVLVSFSVPLIERDSLLLLSSSLSADH